VRTIGVELEAEELLARFAALRSVDASVVDLSRRRMRADHIDDVAVRRRSFEVDLVVSGRQLDVEDNAIGVAFLAKDLYERRVLDFVRYDDEPVADDRDPADVVGFGNAAPEVHGLAAPRDARKSGERDGVRRRDRRRERNKGQQHAHVAAHCSHVADRSPGIGQLSDSAARECREVEYSDVQ